MITVRLLGPIQRPGLVEVDESITFKKLLGEYGGGMIRKYPRAIVMQVGGPLGTIVSGNRINDRVRDYVAEIRTAHIVTFFSERFCSVDFLRFLTRFLVREIRLDTPHVREVNRIICDITRGHSDEQSLEMLRNIAAVDKGLTYGEYRLNVIINDLMDIFGNNFVEHAVGKYCHFSVCRLLFHKKAPCSNSCPSNMYVPGYIELIKHGRLDDAFTLMKQDNPLSFVCGKVCTAPCEKRCRQGDISGTSVAIRQLKRFIADDRLGVSMEYIEDRLPANGKRIVVIGGGPAGISAAFYLAKTGYNVTIYEANERLGGMLTYGIPEYRMPYKGVERELSFLRQMGVKVICNSRVGDAISLKQLRDENDAVLLATGRWIGRRLGPSSSQIEPAMNFLRSIKLGERTSLPKKVVVIGGGAVAMDTAMSAVRLGAETTMVTLEQRDEMLVSDEEILEALEDGIQLLNGWGTKEFVEKEGKLRKILLQRCISVFDDNYRPTLKFDSNDTSEIEADLVVTAIGQDADISYFDKDIDIDTHGNIVLNAAFQTSSEAVFAAGDIKAPGLVISAVGEGKRVAMSIDNYLGGNGIHFGREINIPASRLDPRIWDIPRENPGKLEAEERTQNFAEVESTLHSDQASREVYRCMRCDLNSLQELHLRTV